MMNHCKHIAVVLLALLFIGCKERFEPNLPALQQNYLVIEGFINAGNAPTEIKLSRTSMLNEEQNLKPELNASVLVEGDDNSSFALNSLGNGTYFSPPVFLNPNNKYRIRVQTQEGKEYLSEFTAVKITPPIDSISWREENGGRQIYANTHDPQNNTIYYRWDYDETWQIRSAYYTIFRYIDGTIRVSEADDPNIYDCWKYDTSTNILLGSSAKLQSDIIHLQPLVFIPNEEERMGVRYSVKVRQYALDKEGYQFMEQMKKNTESLGTIFDPQPSALRGNIRCISDPKEQVIGYVGVTTVEEKRIFIDGVGVFNRWFFQDCRTDTVLSKDVPIVIPGSKLPYDAVYDLMGNIVGYKAASPGCVDCRFRGSNIKPSFW